MHYINFVELIPPKNLTLVMFWLDDFARDLNF